ncbi:NAD-dependent epimerase/dehydratase family protein [Martelella endophytica]|uniref:Dihydroflavonol 4-reductase n=1 Tax=Martelella endophytica TaxID=1486262 RepID=A0A0D5LLA1_MAREN|nr:NAD-dependent epimerase/dehydratase family protein [Martelella endophytica]AJY44921.1 dihydroflavonol 4-reductase [Martelella endophytica]
MENGEKKLCVAGASGLVGSHIVKAALAAGYQVNGTLRNARDVAKVPHLMALPGAKHRLTLFSADMAESDHFDAALAGCDAVFIACLTPLYKGRDGTPAREMDDTQGWAEIIKPIEDGALNIMRAADRQSVRNVIICSSTSSTNPPEPVAIKNEIDHVSDLDQQIAAKKYTAAEKTVMEAAARSFAEAHGQRLVILLPTLMLGPTILPEHAERAFHKALADMLDGRKGQHDVVPAGSMSVSHLDDVAALFLAGYENPEASGRYFAVYDSWPWRDIYAEIARHVPADGLPAPLDGEPETPTGFDFTRRDSLGVAMRDIPTTLGQTLDWLKTRPFG